MTQPGDASVKSGLESAIDEIRNGAQRQGAVNGQQRTVQAPASIAAQRLAALKAQKAAPANAHKQPNNASSQSVQGVAPSTPSLSRPISAPALSAPWFDLSQSQLALLPLHKVAVGLVVGLGFLTAVLITAFAWSGLNVTKVPTDFFRSVSQQATIIGEEVQSFSSNAKALLQWGSFWQLAQTANTQESGPELSLAGAAAPLAVAMPAVETEAELKQRLSSFTLNYGREDPFKPLVTTTQDLSDEVEPDPLSGVYFIGLIEGHVAEEDIALLSIPSLDGSGKRKTLVKSVGESFDYKGADLEVRPSDSFTLNISVNGEVRALELQPVADEVAAAAEPDNASGDGVETGGLQLEAPPESEGN